jgi:GH15 family glucan-1,4-alpha-glucosidase
MSSPLEDYAMIGDGQSAALVDRRGSIDWLCWPRFDSDACLAALVGNEQNGHWLLAPRDIEARVTRRYRDDTLTLETDHATGVGVVRVTDFMPPRRSAPALVRLVTVLDGSAAMRMVLRLRFGYGLVPPWIEAGERRMVGRVGPDLVVLTADVPLVHDGRDIRAEFTLGAGQRCAFVLQLGSSHGDPPKALDPPRALADTERYWRGWISRFDKPSDWPDAVRRSLITLKALINATTGGMVAAPTTSLPEVAGGKLNWDYRYCWLRDAAFAISALLNAGYTAEATAWRDWILRAIAGSPEHIQVMYRLDGGRDLNEWTVPWLSGYRWSAPVRVGNAAAHQRQIDIFGELVEVMDLAAQAGIGRDPHWVEVEQEIVERVASVWGKPGQGIWESRGEPRRHVYSQVMAWVAVDRFLKHRGCSSDADPQLLKRLAALRVEMHREICREGFDSGLDTFVEFYGSREVGAALLLIPAVGFLPIDDPRVAGTIARIERELMEDGLVWRTTDSRRRAQGAFLPCSCWLADCRRMQGRHAAAREAFERMLAVRNDVGLLSEEYDIRGRCLTGNFPQALSHLTLVNTALGICGPVLQTP